LVGTRSDLTHESHVAGEAEGAGALGDSWVKIESEVNNNNTVNVIDNLFISILSIYSSTIPKIVIKKQSIAIVAHDN
jgi:hypothetical protein